MGHDVTLRPLENQQPAPPALRSISRKPAQTDTPTTPASLSLPDTGPRIAKTGTATGLSLTTAALTGVGAIGATQALAGGVGLSTFAARRYLPVAGFVTGITGAVNLSLAKSNVGRTGALLQIAGGAGLMGARTNVKLALASSVVGLIGSALAAYDR